MTAADRAEPGRRPGPAAVAMGTLRSRQHQTWMTNHLADRLSLPSLADANPTDVAHQARAVLVRCHPLYPALWRALCADEAADTSGKWGSRLRRFEKAAAIGRRYHPCGRTAVDRGWLYRPARLRVERVLDRMIPAIEATRPWPSLGDLRAWVRMIARDDVFAGFDARIPVPFPMERTTQAIRLIEWAWSQPTNPPAESARKRLPA